MTIYTVTNREVREHTQDRVITYDLNKPLPVDWETLTTDEQGIWLNENAEFIKDFFEEPDFGDIEETTIDIEEIEEE